LIAGLGSNEQGRGRGVPLSVRLSDCGFPLNLFDKKISGSFPPFLDTFLDSSVALRHADIRFVQVETSRLQ
jgi:hypothetical protein